MPPSDPTPMPEAGTAPGDVAASDAGAPGGDGAVMIQVPKAMFDQIHQIVTSLSQTLDAAMGAVNQQKGAAEAPAGPAQQAPAAPAGPSPDEQDLANFAQELSNRGR